MYFLQTGDAKAALEVGKSKNKVLKLVSFDQLLKIQQAQGQDKTAKIAEEATKLASEFTSILVFSSRERGS